MAYIFLEVSHLFFLVCAQKNQTHCTYMWQHKDVKAQFENHVATCLPRP